MLLPKHIYYDITYNFQECENCIKRLVPKDLRTKYHEIFENQMKELKQRYHQELHDLGIREVLVMERGFKSPEILDQPFKLVGHTENRNEFLKNRNIIGKKYFLCHRLIRNVISKAEILPELMCIFGKYRALGFLELSK